jgi:hypothetical protein
MSERANRIGKQYSPAGTSWYGGDDVEKRLLVTVVGMA